MSLALQGSIALFRSLGFSVRHEGDELVIVSNNPVTQMAQLRAVQDQLIKSRQSYHVEFDKTKPLLRILIPIEKKQSVPIVLILVRHGESEQNKILHSTKNPELLKFKIANPGLTETGLAQARCTGFHLASDEESEVWVSELDRAQSTLEAIMRYLPNARTIVKPELNEKNEINVGKREPETLAVFKNRVYEFAKQLTNLDRPLLIVGHSVFFSILTSHLLGEEIDEPVYRNPNCAITQFLKNPNGTWSMTRQGSVEHIPESIRTGVDTPATIMYK